MCGCGQTLPTTTTSPCGPQTDCSDPCSDCVDKGCSAQLDTDCIFFGKNAFREKLEAIGALTGDSLTTILGLINDKLASNNPLDLNGIAFGYLAEKYIIYTFKDAMEALVTELEDLRNQEATQPVSSNPCFTFTIKNKSTSPAIYKYRDCDGILHTGRPLGAGQLLVVNGRGLAATSGDIEVVNNGIL